MKRFAESVARAKGVNVMSIGWLTHSSQVLDIGLDYLG
jgi:nicotinate-nucleotide pyrophosphorylase